MRIAGFLSKRKRAVYLSCGALSISALLMVYSGRKAGSNTATDNILTTQPAGVVATRPASRVFIDPQTGKLQSSPTKAQVRSGALTLPPELENALSTSTSGLQIETGAGGGKMVRLEGRFRHLNVVTTDGDSLSGVRCIDPQSIVVPQSVEGQK